MKLYQAQSEWLTLYNQLAETPIPGTFRAAAPFFSIPDPTPYNLASRPVLLVGQATRAGWFADSYENSRSQSISERVEERRCATKNFLTESEFKRYRNSGFWRMWKKLKRKTEAPVIWSNAAKIGALTGNPPWKAVDAQAELAICTLHAEIDEYKPQMLIFVTGYFARHEIVAPFLGLPKEIEKDGHGLIYTRKRNRDKPAILWTGHPGRQSSSTVEQWLDEALRLLK